MDEAHASHLEGKYRPDFEDGPGVYGKLTSIREEDKDDIRANVMDAAMNAGRAAISTMPVTAEQPRAALRPGTSKQAEGGGKRKRKKQTKEKR